MEENNIGVVTGGSQAEGRCDDRGSAWGQSQGSGVIF
jgi:hypothetical protein